MCLIGERELRPAQTALDSTPPERSLSSMDATAIRRAYESSAGPAKVTGGGMPPPPTPPKTRPTSSSASSAGSVRSQANEARRHAGGRTSGNGPDTTERAPLDARGWVPSVFRARPANDKENGRAMPATPGKKDRLTCAWGLQPKGRKDATRLGQDDGSRRERRNLPRARCRDLDARGGAAAGQPKNVATEREQDESSPASPAAPVRSRDRPPG